MSTFLSINPSLNFSHSLVKESEPESCFLFFFFFKRFNQSGSAPDELFLLFSFSHLSRLRVRLFRLLHKSRLLSPFPILVSNSPFLKDHPTLLPFISHLFFLSLYRSHWLQLQQCKTAFFVFFHQSLSQTNLLPPELSFPPYLNPIPCYRGWVSGSTGSCPGSTFTFSDTIWPLSLSSNFCTDSLTHPDTASYPGLVSGSTASYPGSTSPASLDNSLTLTSLPQLLPCWWTQILYLSSLQICSELKKCVNVQMFIGFAVNGASAPKYFVNRMPGSCWFGLEYSGYNAKLQLNWVASKLLRLTRAS